MDEAFFLPDGDGFVATPLARGPWHPDLLHGGPPAALLGRAVERAPSDVPRQVVRVTVDLLRPVPLGRVEVACSVVRAGRAAQVLEATLSAGGKPCFRATAVRLRIADVPLPPRDPPMVELAPPGACLVWEFPFFRTPVGYHTAMDLRLAAGAFGQGDMAAWMRMRQPLVAGEEPSPLQRVLVAADAGSGVGLALDTERYTFVNADLTVHLHRPLEGEWVGVDARTVPWSSGVGLTESALHDRRGPVGRALQSLVIEARA
ncbi:MAG: thioesterase family protein [Planctomycetes bacterium]|nr:thioesterase family protein [Planctomycetota bacterium]